ncbi:MAG: ABC transporter ATP-binding protein [Alphaproteobacteria bacterium]|nr:ABC transporter ATP-binding protein [Alphaproteobacteria bacterium]
MSEVALDVVGVRKVYGRVVALDRVDLVVPAGTFVGLIGHNGAGKSTLLSLLTGQQRPTEGQVRIAGVDVHAQPREALARLGAVPEHPALFEHLSAREMLAFAAEVRGSEGVEAALDLTELGADADRPIREYSQGMRRKTALAMALLGDPPVIVLDEAINGLDPPSAARIKKELRRRVDAGATVLLSTHVVETVAAVADRVVMLAHGRVVADVRTTDLGPGALEALFLERLEAERDGGSAG